MKRKNFFFKNIKYLILIIIILLFIYLFNFCYEKKMINYKSDLKKDGFKILEKNENALKYLPDNYVFLNYIYEIKGCTLQTFHRDVTSSSYYYKTKYPVYTLIKYDNTGDLLSLCRGSHLTTPYVWNSPEIINLKEKGKQILFNCDVLHSGAMNNLKEKRHAYQFKIAHKDDLYKLLHLEGIKKISDVKCDKSIFYYDYILRKISLLFPYIINHLFTPYLQEYQNNKFNDIVLFIFGKEFYNKN